MLKKKDKNSKKPKILFYIANPYVFRSGPIGYLYEICQVYPTVFISEKLDPETEKVLQDKTLFPKLETVVPISQFTGERRNLFSKNIYLWKLAKEILKKYKPEIIITRSDTHSLFELYLMRFAKRKNIIKIVVQTANIGESSLVSKRVDLTNAYSKFPVFLPFPIRHFLARARKCLGHFLVYHFLPLLVGERPFWGKSSYILYRGNSGMRDADYQTAFSQKDYNIYLKEGVPVEKLYIVAPSYFKTKTREFFKKAFWSSDEKKKNNEKILLFLLPEDKIGFKRKDFSLISIEKMEKARTEAVKLAIGMLPDWKFFLKPHPDIKNVKEAVRGFESIADNLKILNKDMPLDKYIELSDVIAELPLAAGNALFNAYLQCPEKPIISLDFNQELLGDYYKDFRGIEYIDNKEKFIEILELIKNNKYRKKYEINPEPNSFPGIVEFLKFLLKFKTRH